MPSFDLESTYWQQGRLVAGMDEVGYGSWAGPLLMVAVQWPPNLRVDAAIEDSKRLSAKRRTHAYCRIVTSGCAIGRGWVRAAEISRIGLARAHDLAAARALDDLPSLPDAVLIDGTRRIQGLPCPYSLILKGDQKSLSIASASIIAKTERDEWMRDHPLADRYGWSRNSGYGTQGHIQSIEKYGPSEEHRMNIGRLNQLGLGL